jgi:hypothetical protein
MAKKLKIDTEINVVINASLDKLNKVKEQINQMNTGIPGIGKGTVEGFQNIGDEIDRIQNNMKADLLAGNMTNPELLKSYTTELETQEKALRKITDTTMKRVAGDKEFSDNLTKSTNAIIAQEKVLSEKERTLDNIKSKTEKITKAEIDAAATLGISVGSINTNKGIDDEIAKRTTPGGKPKTKAMGVEIKELQKIKKLREDMVEDEKKLVDEREKASAELEREKGVLESMKNQRQQLLLDQVSKMEKEKDPKTGKFKITKAQADFLRHNIALGKSFDDIGKSVKNVSFKKIISEIDKNQKTTAKAVKTNEDKKKSFLENITAATLYYAAIRTLRRLMRQTVTTVTELDKSFTQIAMVTGMTRKES